MTPDRMLRRRVAMTGRAREQRRLQRQFKDGLLAEIERNRVAGAILISGIRNPKFPAHRQTPERRDP